MNSQETARQLMAENHLKDEQLEKTMLERAEEELLDGKAQAKDLEERSRELLAKQRQHEQALDDTMLTRSQEQLDS